jgi:hypothetical protein
LWAVPLYSLLCGSPLALRLNFVCFGGMGFDGVWVTLLLSLLLWLLV